MKEEKKQLMNNVRLQKIKEQITFMDLLIVTICTNNLITKES